MTGPPFVHGVATIGPGVRIHHVSLGSGPRAVLLIHGFPQSWWKWREVMPVLADAGMRVVAVDYRGAGSSSRPRDGYDKWTMATDLHLLVRDHLSLTEPVAVIGHDIGAMVAFAYAAQYRHSTSRLGIVDSAGIPGTSTFDALRASSRLWHFG